MDVTKRKKLVNNIENTALLTTDENSKFMSKLAEGTPLSRVRRALNFESVETEVNSDLNNKTSPQPILESKLKNAMQGADCKEKTDDISYLKAVKENLLPLQKLNQDIPLIPEDRDGHFCDEQFGVDNDTVNFNIGDNENDIIEAVIKETRDIMQSETTITERTANCKPRIIECKKINPSLNLDKLLKGQFFEDDNNDNGLDRKIFNIYLVTYHN